MHKSILGLALAASASAAFAVTPAPTVESYLVAFELREGGRLVGAPSLAVRIGEPATIIVGGAYKLELTLDRAGGNGFFVRSGFYRPAGAGWALFASPTVAVAAGEQGRVTVQRAASEPPYSIAFTVR